MSQIAFALIACAATYLGGLFVIRFKSKINLIMGFTAGVLLGVIAFEILPEIIEMIKEHDLSISPIMIALVGGFLLFHILEKTLLIHHAHEDEYAAHKHPQVGSFSALALAGHSFLDGVAIGLAFQVNEGVGLVVALAVIAHDFSDGMNTVALMLRHKNSDRRAKVFLLIDALAPLLGALATLFFTVQPETLALFLGFFAGFLLYIGATDILPEAHSAKSSFKTIGLTVAGAALIFIISRFG